MWDELFSRLGRDEVFALSMTTLIGVILFSVVFLIQWRKMRQAELDASLKREMVNRGMSPGEILAILGAAPAPRRPAEPRQPADDLHVHAQRFANEIRDNVKEVLNKVAARL
jgi:hypothetical protein